MMFFDEVLGWFYLCRAKKNCDAQRRRRNGSVASSTVAFGVSDLVL